MALTTLLFCLWRWSYLQGRGLDVLAIMGVTALAVGGTMLAYAYSLKKINGAGGRNRTPDLRITSALLYRLSYASSTPSF